MNNIEFRKFLKRFRHRKYNPNNASNDISMLYALTKKKKYNNITMNLFKKTISHLYKIKDTVLNETPKLSNGEKKIKAYLELVKLEYESEKEFEDLKNPKTGFKLRCDFYIPSKNTVIEFDGIQHYEYVKEFDKKNKEAFLERQYRDSVKDEYCKEKNIKLIRIPYTEYERIETLLKDAFNN